jgi:hypothetical protein
VTSVIAVVDTPSIFVLWLPFARSSSPKNPSREGKCLPWSFEGLYEIIRSVNSEWLEIAKISRYIFCTCDEMAQIFKQDKHTCT